MDDFFFIFKLNETQREIKRQFITLNGENAPLKIVFGNIFEFHFLKVLRDVTENKRS